MKIPTTQLWLGEYDLLTRKVYDFAAGIFGADKQDLIVARQFYHMSWFTPEKNNYTKADIEPIFHRTSFALDAEECHLIILEHADMLSAVCANMLLKLLEEPPAGYHFILLAQRLDAIVSTIQSRSIITDYGFQQKSIHADFVQFLKNPVRGNHLQVMQEFEKAKMTEYESKLLIDQLFAHWAKEYMAALQKNDTIAAKRADRMVRICQYSLEYPPMPGSSKIFWRNVYVLMAMEKIT